MAASKNDNTSIHQPPYITLSFCSHFLFPSSTPGPQWPATNQTQSCSPALSSGFFRKSWNTFLWFCVWIVSWRAQYLQLPWGFDWDTQSSWDMFCGVPSQFIMTEMIMIGSCRFDWQVYKLIKVWHGFEFSSSSCWHTWHWEVNPNPSLKCQHNTIARREGWNWTIQENPSLIMYFTFFASVLEFSLSTIFDNS